MAFDGKLVVVLLAREALFLRGGDDLAVDDQRGGGVVVKGGDPENRRHARRSARVAKHGIIPPRAHGAPDTPLSACGASGFASRQAERR